MLLKITSLITLAAAAVGVRSSTPAQRTDPPEDVVVVRMVDKSPTEFVFEPESVTVRPGQTVRFVQKGAMPHNVEFRETPDGTDLGTSAMGPFLLSLGDTYDVEIDDRFAPGIHKYVCTPHELLGMVGSITVEAGTP